jgi:hypothetical protein
MPANHREFFSKKFKVFYKNSDKSFEGSWTDFQVLKKTCEVQLTVNLSPTGKAGNNSTSYLPPPAVKLRRLFRRKEKPS